MIATVAGPNDRPVGLDATPAIFIFSWAFLSVAAGYRWFGVGVDYPDYIEWWGSLVSWSNVVEGRFETLFAALGLAFKLLGLSFEAYSAALVAIALGIKLSLIYRHTRSPLLALICYIPLFYVLHEYTQLRAAVAIAFGLLASFAFIRGDRLVAGAWLIIGATFQSSVLALGFGFLFIMAMANVWTMIGYAAIIAAGIAYLLTIDPLTLFATLNPLLLSYVATAQTYEPPSIFSPQNVLLVGAILAAGRAAAADQQYRLYLVMCVLALVGFGVFYDVSVVGNRLFGLFFVFVIFLSFQSKRFDVAALAGVFTLASAAWAVRNAIEQKLIG